MFFKRKNVGSNFSEAELLNTKSETHTKQVSKPNSSSAVHSSMIEEKVRKMEAERKQLEHDQTIKHYYHSKLLDTLDLGLLSHLQEDRAKEELREAVVHLIAEDQTHPLSSEARNRMIRQIEDEIFGLGPLEPLLADSDHVGKVSSCQSANCSISMICSGVSVLWIKLSAVMLGRFWK